MVRDWLLSIDKRLNIRENLSRRLKNRRFMRDSGLLLLANLIVVGLGVIRTPAMTWILPKDEVGMLGVVGAWLPFLQLLSLPGMDSAAYHYVAKGQPWAFVVNLVYRLRWSLLSTAGFLIGALIWSWRGDQPLAWMFVIAGFSYPITIGLSASAGMLAAQERFVGLFWYRIWESLTDFAGFIPLLLALIWISPAVTFYSSNQLTTAIMQVGYGLALFWQLRKLGTSRMPPADEKELVRYGKHLSVMAGIGVVQTRTDALLVGMFLPLSTMADYTIALLVYEQFKRLWNIYVSVRYPPLVRLPVARRFRRMLREGLLIWAGFFVTGLALALLATWLIPIILPTSYSSSLPFIYWLIATFVISVPGFYAEIYFRTEQDEKRQYMMRTAAAVIGVALPAALVTTWGATGVVFGRFLAGMTLSVFGIFLSYRFRQPASSESGD